MLSPPNGPLKCPRLGERGERPGTFSLPQAAKAARAVWGRRRTAPLQFHGIRILVSEYDERPFCPPYRYGWSNKCGLAVNNIPIYLQLFTLDGPAPAPNINEHRPSAIFPLGGCMRSKRSIFLLQVVALCLAGPLAAIAQATGGSSSVEPVHRPLPRVAGPAFSGRAVTPEPSHEIPTVAPPCTVSPETSHASLTLTKDGSGNPILSWSGTGPYTVTRSTSPGFTYQVGTLAQSTSATSYTDSATSGSALVYYYDIADEGVGEVSEAVWGLGYLPPVPPAVTSVSSFGAWVGDTVTLTGQNFDPIALENQVMWNQIPATVVNDGSNTTTSLKAIIPKGATQAGVSLCAYQVCSPADPWNANAVVEVANTTFTDIGTMAFDNSASGGDHQLRVADRGTSAIYSVDPEVKGSPAITTLATGISQPMIPTFCLSDGSVLYTSGAGGTPSDTIYSLSRGGGTPTTYATTRDAQTNTCHNVDPQAGVTPRALAVNPNSSGYAYIADAASGYIRRIQQGTTLSTTATTAIDPTYGGLHLGTLGDPCPFTTNPDYTGVVNAINAGGDYYGVNVSSCPSTNFLPGGNLGTGITSLVLNEVFFNWLWIVATPGRALAFAQEASTHYGFLANAFADEITRLPDPDIQIEPSMPTKVLISNKVTSIPYPSANQTADAQVRIDIVASVANARVYLRAIDPTDSAAYVQPVTCGSVTGCDCGIQGQMCDNKDTYANWGFGAGRTKTAYVDTDNNGLGSIILYTTTRYAGDNYQVQASYQALNQGAPFSNAHIKASSGILTAWKRVFVERDRMFRKGGLLFADFNKDTCSPNCNKILVYDWATVADGDGIVVFDETTTAEAGSEVRTVQGVPVPGPPNSGYETVTLNANLTKNYYATSNNGSSPPVPTFSNGRSGGVGVLSGDPEVINGSGARFYDVDMGAIPQAYNDAFVEFVAPRSGEGAVPYVSEAMVDLIENFTLAAGFSQVWFANKSPVSGDPLRNNRHNYFHLIGAGKNQLSALGFSYGKSGYDADCSYISVGQIEYYYGTPTNEPIVTHTTIHELGHQWYDSINTCDTTNGHDSNYAWCGAPSGACPDVAYGYQKCVMYIAADLLDPTFTQLISDGIDRFCCSNLGGTAATPPCGNSACAGEVGIRQAPDPE